MKHRKRMLPIAAVLVVLVAVAAAAFFRSKPMLDLADTLQVRSISADYWKGGVYSAENVQALLIKWADSI